MKKIVNTFKLLACVVKVTFLALLIPIPFLLDLIIAIPQIIFAQLNVHKRLIIILCFCAIFFTGLHRAFPNDNVFYGLYVTIKTRQYTNPVFINLFFASLLPAIVIRLVVKYVDNFFCRLDETFYSFYAGNVRRIFSLGRSIKTCAEMITYGSYRKRELFEMNAFKAQYHLS